MEEKATTWIQQEIDRVHEQGGGRAVIPAGDHICGTLYLKSGVELHLEKGARIIGSSDLSDYPLHLAPSIRCHADWDGMRSLLYSDGHDSIAITGHGVIDGNGGAFPYGGTDRDGRPRLIQFIGCRDVLIQSVHLRNSGMWLQHYLGCRNLKIEGVSGWNHVQPNNDFVDIEGCKGVVVTNCFSDTDDDGITLKSGSENPSEDVVISNCIVRSHCNAIKCGTESNGGFRNISIANCTVAPSEHDSNIHGSPEGICGIALESVDGGVLENVSVSNISIRGTCSPIYIRLGKRNRSYLQDGETVHQMGVVRNIQLSNISVIEAGSIGCLVSGFPENYVENVCLRDISITLSKTVPDARTPESVPEKPESYPEATQFGNLPANGFFFRHAKNIRLDNVQIYPMPEDPRPNFSELDAIVHHR